MERKGGGGGGGIIPGVPTIKTTVGETSHWKLSLHVLPMEPKSIHVGYRSLSVVNYMYSDSG